MNLATLRLYGWVFLFTAIVNVAFGRDTAAAGMLIASALLLHAGSRNLK